MGGRGLPGDAVRACHDLPVRGGQAARGAALAAALAVLAGGGVQAGGCGQSADERVAGRPGRVSVEVDRRRAVVWAVGDGADDGADARSVATLLRRSRVDRLLYLGDVYEHGTAKEFRRNFAGVYGSLAARTAPTPGNHEWPNHLTGYDRYWRRVTGRRMPAYYAFDLAGWRVLSLNSEAPHAEGSPQLRWLRAQLRRPGTCRIAFWHRPRYSRGRHGDQEDVEPFWRALAGRAALVLNGHDHDMQRFRPIGGITEVVSGAGGRELYEVERGDPRLAFADDSSHGALRLELAPGLAHHAFVTADGRVLDSGQVRCRR